MTLPALLMGPEPCPEPSEPGSESEPYPDAHSASESEPCPEEEDSLGRCSDEDPESFFRAFEHLEVKGKKIHSSAVKKVQGWFLEAEKVRRAWQAEALGQFEGPGRRMAGGGHYVDVREEPLKEERVGSKLLLAPESKKQNRSTESSAPCSRETQTAVLPAGAGPSAPAQGGRSSFGVLLGRIWFALMVVSALAPARALGALLHAMLPRELALRLCRRMCQRACQVALKTQPHISLVDRTSPEDKAALARDLAAGSVACLLNHSSFMDTVVFFSVAPSKLMEYARTFMKAGLRQYPLLGPITRCLGHLPVHFKSEAEGAFAVDKEKMKAEKAVMRHHLAEGGSLFLFPEGQINKTPEILAPFRRGSFSLLAERRMPQWALLMTGNELTWPKWASLGGWPATIQYQFVPVLRSCPPNVEVTGEQLSELARWKMQRALDGLRGAEGQKREEEGMARKLSIRLPPQRASLIPEELMGA